MSVHTRRMNHLEYLCSIIKYTPCSHAYLQLMKILYWSLELDASYTRKPSFIKYSF